MEIPDPTTIAKNFWQNPWGYALGAILIILLAVAVTVATRYAGYKTDEILVGGGARPEKTPPPVEERDPPAKPAPTAPQPHVAQKSEAPAAPPPQPPAPCSHVLLPIKPAALVTVADRLCALAACSGQPHDAPAIQALRTWTKLAHESKSCDLADREALGDYEALKKLVAIASAPPASPRADERATCLDVRQALLDEISSLSAKINLDEKAEQRCGASAQKTVSATVDAVMGQLR